MKKLLAIILTVFMIVPLCSVCTCAAEVNIAKGKSYALTGQYTNPEDGRICYPDTNNSKLTDGIKGFKSDIGYGSNIWVGLNVNAKDIQNGEFFITVDLGSVTSKLAKFSLTAQECIGGIGIPESIEVLISDDNNDYTSLGIANPLMIQDLSDENNPMYGIYDFSLSLPSGHSARYIRFAATFGLAWAFVSEVEIYQDPSVPEALESYSLLPTELSDWKSSPEEHGECAVVSMSGSSVVISGSKSYWPHAYFDLSEPITVDIDEYNLVYDFTVTEGQTNIVLFCEGSKCASNENYIADITHLMAPEGSAQRPLGDDLKDGTYKGKISLSELNYSNVKIKESGKISISSLKVFTIAGAAITIKKFALEPISELMDDDIDSQGIQYDLNSADKTASVYTAAGNLPANVTIPGKVKKDGVIYTVKSIHEGAFSGCSEITDVSIPCSISEIEAGAFFMCSGITSITIPEGVVNIGEEAFAMTGLKSIFLPSSLKTIGAGAFFNCTELTEIMVNQNSRAFVSEDNILFDREKSVLVQYPIGNTSSEFTIPSSVKTIGDLAFGYCINLKKINLPDGLRTINQGAFTSCINITEIAFPISLNTIGMGAFAGCTGLTTVTIPENVSVIEDMAFAACTGLTAFSVKTGNAYYSNDSWGALFTKDMSKLLQYPTSNTASSYIIPDGVKIISDFSFAGNADLKNIKVPDGVTSIGKMAFMSCEKLFDITLPDSIVSIGMLAFDSTPWYENKAGGLVYIGKALYSYKGIAPDNASITVLDGTKSISAYAFSGSKIGSISIPDSVVEIGDEAFSNCELLTKIMLPGSITNIGAGIFADCTSLTDAIISEGITEIPDGTFSFCIKLKSVSIPKSVKKISDNTFEGCYELLLYVYENSYAFDYAKENDLRYMLIMIRDPDVVLENGFILGFTDGLTCNDMISKLGGTVTVSDANGKEISGSSKIVTGTVISFNGENYMVVIKGDLNGDGTIDSVDCLLLKKLIVGTGELEGAYLKAACVSGTDTPDSADYLKIKKHIIGNYNLFSKMSS